MSARKKKRSWDELQADPEFVAWVATVEPILDLEIDELIPGLGDRPWGPKELDLAGDRLLELYPPGSRSAEPLFPENVASTSRFVMVIGQAMVDNFEGKWINWPTEDGTEPAVFFPASPLPLDLIGLVTSSVHRRTGDEWSGLFDYQQPNYDEWVAGGRLEYEEWIRVRFPEWLEPDYPG